MNRTKPAKTLSLILVMTVWRFLKQILTKEMAETNAHS